MRILVVDDDPTMRELLRLHLEVDGHEVVEAEDGAEALERVTALRPELVVLDVMMPALDGWTVLERLRRQDAHRTLPVVLLSARDVADDVRRGYDAGASAVLSKSRVEDLGRTVAAVTARLVPLT